MIPITKSSFDLTFFNNFHFYFFKEKYIIASIIDLIIMKKFHYGYCS